MLSSLLQLLFNAADVVVVGRCAGEAALAAVGSTSSLARSTPLISEMVMAVWTLLWTSSSLPLPMSRATTTLVPTEKPTNRLTSRLIRELVDPTAASAASPAQRPTTTTSV